MKFVWVIGRFSLLGLILIGFLPIVGCEQPMSALSLILPIRTENSGTASTQSDDEQAQQKTNSAEDLVNDWEKPEFALFISGRQHGYIEPCGCTGLANQKGGLMRRHSCQKILQQIRGWDLVSLDAGNQVRRFGQQPTIKMTRTIESLCGVMDYDMIGLGPDDLKMPSLSLAQEMLNAKENNPFVCANVEVVDPSVSNKFLTIEKNGKRIGVTMVVGDEHLADFADKKDLVITSAAQGLSVVVPQMLNAKCDLNVLLAQASPEVCRKLAKQFPIFDLLVTAGGGGDPTLHPEIIQVDDQGKITSMIQVGVKGMHVGIVGYYDNGGEPTLKYERVPLDERFEDSPEIKQVFFNYQQDLKKLWLAGKLEDIKPRPHPTGHTFVGSQACADCHNEEFEIWIDGVDGDGGPHEKATRDLTNPGERSWVQRHFDPECVSCHVTGWNPQLYYPYESGYLDLEKDVALHANGCENCHGPGSAHVDAERNKKDDQALLDRLRAEVRLTIEEAKQSACVQCHDLDNSPEYVKEGGFDEYWPHIEH